jgi:FkbM family methyltransferase
MTMTTRDAAGTATDAACRIFGRRSVIRAARYVLLRARLDYPNDMAGNGEADLQRWVLGMTRRGEKIAMADVGANIGLWSRSLLSAAATAGRGADVDLHAFEPNEQAFAQLSQTLDGVSAVLSPVALSDRNGTATFHVAAPAAGTNSLHPQPGAALLQESVSTVTLDSYAADRNIPGFALVKIDTEGHDLAVIRGAQAMLAGHRIDVVQFEYNHRWVFARSFLWDAFEFLAGVGYQIGKLTPRGVEFYPAWDAELETFVEGNYVACVPAAASALPRIPWWKTDDHSL